MRWRILCYHQVHPEYADGFDRQLRLLADRGVTFCGFSEGFRWLSEGREGDYATVTFDDGDATVFEVAKPLLDALGIKALLYLSTDCVARGSIYHSAAGGRALSWEQIRSWVADGHEIGDHTHTHPDLRVTAAERIVEEIRTSQVIISEQLGVEANHFAYPWGCYNEAAVSVLRERTGLLSSATVVRGWNTEKTDPFELRRDVVEPSWSTSRFLFYLGLGTSHKIYDFYKFLCHLKAR